MQVQGELAGRLKNPAPPTYPDIGTTDQPVPDPRQRRYGAHPRPRKTKPARDPRTQVDNREGSRILGRTTSFRPSRSDEVIRQRRQPIGSPAKQFLTNRSIVRLYRCALAARRTHARPGCAHAPPGRARPGPCPLRSPHRQGMSPHTPNLLLPLVPAAVDVGTSGPPSAHSIRAQRPTDRHGGRA